MDTKKLNDSQLKAVSRLQELLVFYANLTDKQKSECFPLVSSTIGILGGRGSGKSSLLNHFYHHSRCPADPCLKLCESVDNSEEWCRLRENVIVLKPLDCSTLPEECEPGMAVLSHIHEELTSLRHQAGKCSEKNLPSILSKLKDVVGLYTRIGRGYNELSLDLSSSPDDYGDYLSSGLKARMGMKDALRNWLDDFFSELNKVKVGKSEKIIVVPLDDFDLIPNSYHKTQHWISSLLGELCQNRLCFVITADFYRLEHLAWGEPIDFDKKTGHAIVNKLLPPQNRVLLESFIKRLEFIPKNHPKVNEEPSAIRAKLVELFPGSDNESIVLGQMIKAVLRPGTLNEAILYALLPSLPRGLESLYLSLKSSLLDLSTHETLSQHVLLQLLATSRNESLLARIFTPLGLEVWFASLSFGPINMDVEHWIEIVDRATQRAKHESCGEEPRLLPLEIHLDGEDGIGKINMQEQGADAVRDPLRRADQEKRPLKDAAEGERMLWAELIFDIYFAASPRYRSRFLLDWPTTNSRLEACGFRFNINLSLNHSFFLDNPGLTRSTFYWICPNKELNSGYSIGWQALFSALRLERDVFDANLFEEMVSYPLLLMSGDLPGPEALELLPNRLWALILFSDGLHRCPWAAFSGTSVWMVGTYLGLAAAFVRSAYAYAMDKAFAETLVGFSPVQRRFVAMIQKRDPVKFLREGQSIRREDEVLLCLKELFEDGFKADIDRKLEELQAEAGRLVDKAVYEQMSLLAAAASYLHSPVYESVEKLLEPYWRKIPDKPATGPEAA